MVRQYGGATSLRLLIDFVEDGWPQRAATKSAWAARQDCWPFTLRRFEIVSQEAAPEMRSSTRSSSRSGFFGQPGFDQRLVGNIPFVGRHLNALKKRHRQAQRYRGR